MDSRYLEWIDRLVASSGDVFEFVVTFAAGVAGLLLEVSLAHLDTILSLTVFWFSYRLMKTGLEQLRLRSDRRGSPPPSAYLKFVVPGALFSLLGTVFLLGRDPQLLAIALMTLVVAAGCGTAGLGYVLYTKVPAPGAAVDVDPRRVLLTRTGPAAVLVAGGLVAALLALSSFREHVRDYSAAYRDTRLERVESLDARLGEILEALKKAASGNSSVPEVQDESRQAAVPES